MRVLFLGTGEIGIPALRWLIESPAHEVIGLVTQPDKPGGRKMLPIPPPTKRIAEDAGVPVFQPARIRRFAGEIDALDPDIIVVAAYGQLLPKAVLDAPKLACLNLHASLLPKYRGAAPIQAAIRDGESESGMTVMYMSEGLDEGDILLAEPVPILPDDTAAALHDRLAEVGPFALRQALDLIAAGNAPRTPQDEAAATHQPKLGREDGAIDWSDPADRIERLIRAYHPWPGTFTRLGGKILKIYPPTAIDGQHDGAPGTVLQAGAGAGGIAVATGHGALVLREVQLEGRKRMEAGAFVAGHPLSGARFG